MRARTLLLVGVALGVTGALVALIVDAASDPPDPSGDASLFDAPAIAGGATGLVLLGVLSFVAGWFGRDRDDPALVALGLAAAVLVAATVVAATSGEPLLAAAVPSAIFAGVAWVVARIAFAVGNAVCEVQGLPTADDLTTPAFPEESPGASLWTTEAGPAIRRHLGSLATALGADGTADAQAVGIRVALPRDRPVLLSLVGGRLAIQPVDLRGEPLDEPTVLDSTDLRQVSIRNEAADGSSRRQGNAYDDVIRVRTASGGRIVLRLPYGTRGAGTSTGGPDVIRSWLRTTAPTYR